MDYAPEDAIVLLCDHGNIRRGHPGSSRTRWVNCWTALLETGQLAGELCDFYSPWEQLCQSLTPRQTVYLDAFLAASYPEQPAPQKLLTINAKQLPCYGGSVETAAADLAFYRKERYACLVLCGNRRRGEILHEMLREREIPAILAFPLTQLPPAGTIYLTDGTLPGGMEYAALQPGGAFRRTAAAEETGPAAKGTCQGVQPAEAALVYGPDAGRPRCPYLSRHWPL